VIVVAFGLLQMRGERVWGHHMPRNRCAIVLCSWVWNRDAIGHYVVFCELLILLMNR